MSNSETVLWRGERQGLLGSWCSLSVHPQPWLHRTLWSWGVWYKCVPQTNNSFLTIRPPSAPKVGNPSSKPHGEPFTPAGFHLLLNLLYSLPPSLTLPRQCRLPLLRRVRNTIALASTDLELPEATMALLLKNTFLCSLLLNCSHTLPQWCSLYPIQIWT